MFVMQLESIIKINTEKFICKRLNFTHSTKSCCNFINVTLFLQLTLTHILYSKIQNTKKMKKIVVFCFLFCINNLETYTLKYARELMIH